MKTKPITKELQDQITRLDAALTKEFGCDFAYPTEETIQFVVTVDIDYSATVEARELAIRHIKRILEQGIQGSGGADRHGYGFNIKTATLVK
jgi:hypothetical protein